MNTIQMNNFDRQDAFNKAFLGLQSQGFKKSAKRLRPEEDDYEMLCMYRGPEGRKCAVGWMIPDDQYQEGMENTVASAILSGLRHSDEIWINQLQEVHDYLVEDTMEDRLRTFADLNHLTIPRQPVAA